MGAERTATQVCEELRSASGSRLDRLIRQNSADERSSVRSAVEQARRRLAAERREARRLAALYRAVAALAPEDATVVAGVDEVGRGALAGPVTAAAVVLPAHPRIPGLDDSKALAPDVREEVAARILSVSLGCSVVHVDASEIDQTGIAQAVRAAMRRALAQLEPLADHVLVDGDRGGVSDRETTVVRGDATVATIAAASVVAKVERDRLMLDLSSRFPGYGFAENKGYGTREHLAAIASLGLSELHRRSFSPCGGTQPLF